MSRTCSLWFTLLALATPAIVPAAPDPSGQQVVRKAEAEIRKHYRDPVIERQECPFPGLFAFTAFEREHLNEDPIIPEQWFATAELPTQRTLPLDRLRHQPKDEAEARTLARWLLATAHRWSRTIAIRVEVDAAAKRMRVILTAEFSATHPMFRGPRKTGRAVVTVADGRWSLQVDAPFEIPRKGP